MKMPNSLNVNKGRYLPVAGKLFLGKEVLEVLTGKRAILDDEKVVDSWSLVIEGGRGYREQIYRDIEKYVRQSNLPEIGVKRIKVSPRWLLGPVFSKDGEYLMATNGNLRDYRLYITAKDYGYNLGVFSYLSCEPGFLERFVSSLLTKGTSDRALSLTLNLFEQQELITYATTVHRCLLKAIERVMVQLGQDPSNISKKTKGFLGIS
jgi:hypothetical protein